MSSQRGLAVSAQGQRAGAGPHLARGLPLRRGISLDTKHILAWVKENNPRCFVEERFDKTRQPKGDPDCKLGCKKKSNQGAGSDDEASERPATPTTEGLPASETLPKLEKGEYYWGYASGVVATKVDDDGEFVLADFTQTFDKGDATYFLPLMAQTEADLGRKPKNGALDKAYDAFYVHEYFHTAGGFAAIYLADLATTTRPSPLMAYPCARRVSPCRSSAPASNRVTARCRMRWAASRVRCSSPKNR